MFESSLYILSQFIFRESVLVYDHFFYFELFLVGFGVHQLLSF